MYTRFLQHATQRRVLGEKSEGEGVGISLPGLGYRSYDHPGKKPVRRVMVCVVAGLTAVPHGV